jgi:hypothetical protein
VSIFLSKELRVLKMKMRSKHANKRVRNSSLLLLAEMREQTRLLRAISDGLVRIEEITNRLDFRGEALLCS